MRWRGPDDQFVLQHRPPKARLDPWRAYSAVWEEEPDASGVLTPTLVVFLTNRECPFRCVMCDLWVHTLDETVPRGAIPTQIREALAAERGADLVRSARASLTRLAPQGPSGPHGSHIKLYNAGSFFDPRAIPPEDDEAIARTVDGFTRVIVEAHPAFLTGAHAERCLRFRAAIAGRLEVAVGLETAHPGVLARLNKRMTLDSFGRAADFLAAHEIDLRVFILLNPPFLRPDEGVEWACRSIDLAAERGATACSVIPTRGGNGAMEALGEPAQAPRLVALEAVVEYGISRRTGRVLADLWDLERFYECACSPARAERLRVMNLTQRVPPPLACADCLGTS